MNTLAVAAMALSVGCAASDRFAAAPSAPTVRIATPALDVRGAHAEESVQRALDDSHGAVRGCYDQGAGRSGTFVVRFAIGADGRVSSANPSGGSLEDPAVGACLLQRVRGLSFPAASGVTVVTWALDFRAVGGSTEPPPAPPSNTSSGTTPVASAAPTAPSAGPATSESPPSAASCTLALARGSHNAGLGNRIDYVEIVNLGTAPCLLQGYPSVALEAVNGEAMPHHVLNEETSYFGSAGGGPPSKVTLPTNTRAHFAVAYIATSGTCPTSASLRVTLAGAAPKRIPLPIQQCATDTLMVMPIRPGPSP